jgi:hypothetical protein
LSDDQNPRPKDIKEMVGEFFREVAALVIVFAFLDKLVLRENITLAWAAATVTLAFVLLVLGIWIERRRK